MKGRRYLLILLAVAVGVIAWFLLGPKRGASPPTEPPAGARTASAEKASSQSRPTEPAPAGMEPIGLQLPEPMFAGTPKPVDEPNIEEPLGKPRPPFLAPEGTANLALGKPVTSSDPWPVIGGLAQVTDGDKAGMQGGFVELGPGAQWVQIDLEQEATIYAVVVWHYHAQARAYRDVIVQLSNDPDFVSGVTTVFNNDHDGSSGLAVGTDKGYVETCEGKLIDCKGLRARHVRLFSNGNSSDDGNHYTEMEAYGQPVQ